MPTTVTDYTALISDATWSGDLGTPTVVTYSFETSAQDYLSGMSGFSAAFLGTFQAFNSAQQSLTQTALDEWEANSGLTFVEVPSGQGDLRFANYDLNLQPSMNGIAGYAYFASRYIYQWNDFEAPIGGDIFIETSRMDSMSYYIILHEIGHALGLEHPHEGDFVLTAALDNTDNTVMSYNPTASISVAPLDQDAIQYMYGDAAMTPDAGGGFQSLVLDEPNGLVTTVFGTADSEIEGTSLRDHISAGAGDDLAGGFKGDDTLDGQGGADTLIGGEGDDTLIGGAGNDRLIGGTQWDDDSGTDTADYRADGSGLTINLANSVYINGAWGNAHGAGSGADYLYVIDNIIAGGGNDTVTGSDGANDLELRNGADSAESGAGDDTVTGGNGADTLDGGTGDDQVVGDRAADLLLGRTGSDAIEGGAGDDDIRGHGGKDTLSGGSGDDTLSGGDHDDDLSGGSGADALNGGAHDDTLDGGDGGDVLEGESGADSLRGGKGNDTLSGGADNDILAGQRHDDLLNGGAGEDTLRGGGGEDTLSGDSGNDLLEGEGGQDIFVFADGEGQDTISDFDALDAGEQIDLTGISTISNFADLSTRASQQSGDVLITFNASNSVLLQNTGLADLDASDFIF